MIVIRLTTELRAPEDIILQEFEESDSMYILAKGECAVEFTDEKRKKINKKKTLRIGDYFGEIALLYGCKRSATVISTKYSSLALLTKENFREI